MKSFLPAFFLFSALFPGQRPALSGYQRIPEILDTAELLYPFIVPDKKYEYWSVLRNHPDPDKAVVYESQMPDRMTLNDPPPQQGFFRKCTGEDCFLYLLACENGKTRYFATEQQLRNFIGTVDNLPEALLVANTYGYTVDTGHAQGSSYRIENEYILLYLVKPKAHPQTRESFSIKINRRTGKLQAWSEGICCRSEAY